MAPAPAVAAALKVAIEATGAERAFIVSFGEATAGEAPRVEAFLSIRGDASTRPSRTVLAWAGTGTRPRICLDTARDPAFLDGASIRALGLRRVLAAPVPWVPPGKAALVLDGRFAPDHRSPGELPDLLESFAALVGLLLARSRAPAGALERAPVPGARSLLVGSSPAFVELRRLIRQVASWKLPVLIMGDTGSGKEGVARALHFEGARRAGPFVAVNCAAFPETLLESELFGAVRGAYTGSDQDRPGLFRLAHGGTLFLDEVGDMPAPMQAKLLRVLQEGRVRPVGGRLDIPIDVRIVSATHRALGTWAAEGRFRIDLYYRLAVVELNVPALREHIEDLPVIVEELGSRLQEDTDLGPPRLTASAWESLNTYAWPGNVRELEAVLARALLRAGGGEIDASHLDLRRPGLREEKVKPANLEQSMIEEALGRAEGNVTRAASLVGWSRPKLYRRMAALGIPRPKAVKS